eukprot:9291325-Pyramimonas_sp.AAC.1
MSEVWTDGGPEVLGGVRRVLGGVLRGVQEWEGSGDFGRSAEGFGGIGRLWRLWEECGGRGKEEEEEEEEEQEEEEQQEG